MVKRTIVSALVAAYASAQTQPLPIVNESDFTEHFFKNKIDHFNYQSNQTYD